MIVLLFPNSTHQLVISCGSKDFRFKDLHAGALMQRELTGIGQDVDFNLDDTFEGIRVQVRAQRQVVVGGDDLVGQTVLQ